MPTFRLSLLLTLLLTLTACGLKTTPLPEAHTLTSTSSPPLPSPSPLPPNPTMLPSPTPDQTTPTPAPATYLKLRRLTVVSSQYTPIEFILDTDGVYTNPFDPVEINLELELDGPDGKQIHLPAFWYQDFDPASRKPNGLPAWHARFTPSQVGSYTARASLVSPRGKLTSDALAIQVGLDKTKISPGFIRLNPRNPRYFAFDDGTTFYPIGINMGWGGSNPIPDYTHWLDRLSANGGNLIRVWMASWSFGLEWKDTGLGDYTQRLYRAWLLDQLFQLAEERGVYIELVLLNHGAFSASVNPEWADNPYNAANGGPCLNPQDFAVNPLAQDLFKRRLRYTAARWAASPALMDWEWWNEADWTPIDPAQMTSWIKVMTPALRASDPYRHPISISYAKSSVPEVANLPEIDFAQIHVYNSADPAFTFPNLFQQWSKEIPHKPILFAEFGASSGNENQDSIDRAGLHLHNGLWAGAFSGFASPAMYWWWDTYVDPLNLWNVFKGLSVFLREEDMASLQPASPSHSTLRVATRALGTSTRLLVWIHDRNNELSSLQKSEAKLFPNGIKPAPDWLFHPAPISGENLTVHDLQNGAYTAYWFSPADAKWLGKQAIPISGGSATFQIPPFSGDIALKLLPAAEPAPDSP